MYTINDLRTRLGLSTANQVRNRIEAIKDVLIDHLRRGPNNQILIDEDGFSLLKQVQDLYDSGLTLKEASDIIRSSSFKKIDKEFESKSRFIQHETKLDDTGALVALLKEEIAYLRERLAFFEEHPPQQRPSSKEQKQEWWQSLKEEVDGA
jgi:hypothetical protein